jgi:DNA-binding LacI/PurR family transcriptional regulator
MADQSGRGWAKPSIYDVANHAGVSHMTVSRVLNGHPNIRESTRVRVLQAIDEMQYTRSSIARALATSKSMRIGVLVDSPVQWGRTAPCARSRRPPARARTR